MPARIWIFCAVTLLIIVAAFACAPVMLWQGGYPLSVTLDTGGAEPKWVYCDVAHDRKQFDQYASSSRTTDDLRRWSETGNLVEPYRGEVLTPYVRLGGGHNWILGELSDAQLDKFLLVIVAWPSGEFTKTVVVIPDYRKARAITVNCQR